MAEPGTSTESEQSTRNVGLFVFGVIVTIFVLLPETRSAALVLLWFVAPLVAFGTLAQVIRGTHELRSGRGLIFGMACAVLAVGSLPLGLAVASSTLADALSFFGITTALVAVGIARLSVVESTPGPARDIPSPEDLAAAAGDDSLSTQSREGTDRAHPAPARSNDADE